MFRFCLLLFLWVAIISSFIFSAMIYSKAPGLNSRIYRLSGTGAGSYSGW